MTDVLQVRVSAELVTGVKEWIGILDCGGRWLMHMQDKLLGCQIGKSSHGVVCNDTYTVISANMVETIAMIL